MSTGSGVASREQVVVIFADDDTSPTLARDDPPNLAGSDTPSTHIRTILFQITMGVSLANYWRATTPLASACDITIFW